MSEDRGRRRCKASGRPPRTSLSPVPGRPVPPPQAPRTLIVLHDDERRTRELARALTRLNVQFELADLRDFHFSPLLPARRDCVYYNKCGLMPALPYHQQPAPGSASRPVALAAPRHVPADLARLILHWLKQQGCRIINGADALDLESSKSLQLLALRKEGLRVPRSITCAGRDSLIEALRCMPADRRVVVKPDRGAGCADVMCFDTPAIARRFFGSSAAGAALAMAQVWLVQEFVQGPTGGGGESASRRVRWADRPECAGGKEYCYRLEFIGAQVLYGMRMDATRGIDSLRPADAPAQDRRFRVLLHPDVEIPLDPMTYVDFVQRCARLQDGHDMATCGIEFRIDGQHRPRVVDVNVHADYARGAEQTAQQLYSRETMRRGIDVLAEYLRDRLGAD